MKRRGFLAALAGLPAIAKGELAKAGINGPIGGDGLQSSGGFGGPMLPMSSVGFGPMPSSTRDSGNMGIPPELADEYREILGIQSRPPDRRVRSLDPDLASNKSMSLATLVRIQARRDAEREATNRLSWLERRAKLLGFDLAAIRSFVHGEAV
jgi:hypothetical protein